MAPSPSLPLRVLVSSWLFPRPVVAQHHGKVACREVGAPGDAVGDVAVGVGFQVVAGAVEGAEAAAVGADGADAAVALHRGGEVGAGDGGGEADLDAALLALGDGGADGGLGSDVAGQVAALDPGVPIPQVLADPAEGDAQVRQSGGTSLGEEALPVRVEADNASVARQLHQSS